MTNLNNDIESLNKKNEQSTLEYENARTDNLEQISDLNSKVNISF